MATTTQLSFSLAAGHDGFSQWDALGTTPGAWSIVECHPAIVGESLATPSAPACSAARGRASVNRKRSTANSTFYHAFGQPSTCRRSRTWREHSRISAMQRMRLAVGGGRQQRLAGRNRPVRVFQLRPPRKSRAAAEFSLFKTPRLAMMGASREARRASSLACDAIHHGRDLGSRRRCMPDRSPERPAGGAMNWANRGVVSRFLRMGCEEAFRPTAAFRLDVLAILRRPCRSRRETALALRPVPIEAAIWSEPRFETSSDSAFSPPCAPFQISPRLKRHE